MSRIARFSLFLTLAALLGVVVNRAMSDTPTPAVGGDPQYAENGDLKRPEGFETWVHVGTDLGISYSANAARTRRPADEQNHGDFHNVYLHPDAYKQFKATGEFPDKTMLVMTVNEARDKDAGEVVTRGIYQGNRKAVEVTVKNKNRPDGSKTDWAYYDFRGNNATAKAFPDRQCYDCHLEHADIDNVWVQFYPVLRDLAKKAEK